VKKSTPLMAASSTRYLLSAVPPGFESAALGLMSLTSTAEGRARPSNCSRVGRGPRGDTMGDFLTERVRVFLVWADPPRPRRQRQAERSTPGSWQSRSPKRHARRQVGPRSEVGRVWVSPTRQRGPRWRVGLTQTLHGGVTRRSG